MKRRVLRAATSLGILLAFGCLRRASPSHPTPMRPAMGDTTEAPEPTRQCVQDAVNRALADSPSPAAAVVLRVDTGQPLALGTHMAADPCRLTARPGSTMKPILAWLAARARLLSYGEQLTCDGTYPDGFTCPASHGVLGLSDALEVSCNVFAFELASRLGLERIATGFRDFGLGIATGLVQQESAGWVADSAWAASTGLPSDVPVALMVGTGHGPIEVTPLQLALAYRRLAQKLSHPDPEVSDGLRAEIVRGMRRVVQGARGTGTAARVSGLDIAGKTGTAETGPFQMGERAEGQHNGWFVGFAPAGAPRIVTVVLVVEGGNAGKSAASIAGRIFESASTLVD